MPFLFSMLPATPSEPSLPPVDRALPSFALDRDCSPLGNQCSSTPTPFNLTTLQLKFAKYLLKNRYQNGSAMTPFTM